METLSKNKSRRKRSENKSDFRVLSDSGVSCDNSHEDDKMFALDKHKGRGNKIRNGKNTFSVENKIYKSNDSKTNISDSESEDIHFKSRNWKRLRNNFNDAKKDKINGEIEKGSNGSKKQNKNSYKRKVDKVLCDKDHLEQNENDSVGLSVTENSLIRESNNTGKKKRKRKNPGKGKCNLCCVTDKDENDKTKASGSKQPELKEIICNTNKRSRKRTESSESVSRKSTRSSTDEKKICIDELPISQRYQIEKSKEKNKFCFTDSTKNKTNSSISSEEIMNVSIINTNQISGEKHKKHFKKIILQNSFNDTIEENDKKMKKVTHFKKRFLQNSINDVKEENALVCENAKKVEKDIETEHENKKYTADLITSSAICLSENESFCSRKIETENLSLSLNSLDRLGDTIDTVSNKTINISSNSLELLTKKYEEIYNQNFHCSVIVPDIILENKIVRNKRNKNEKIEIRRKSDYMSAKINFSSEIENKSNRAVTSTSKLVFRKKNNLCRSNHNKKITSTDNSNIKEKSLLSSRSSDILDSVKNKKSLRKFRFKFKSNENISRITSHDLIFAGAKLVAATDTEVLRPYSLDSEINEDRNNTLKSSTQNKDNIKSLVKNVSNCSLNNEVNITLNSNKNPFVSISITESSLAENNDSNKLKLINENNKIDQQTELPKPKHIFKFIEKTSIKRPPSRQIGKVKIERPQPEFKIPWNDFKVPNNVPPLKKENFKTISQPIKNVDKDDDIISLYAETIGNESVCEDKDVRADLDLDDMNDEEDVVNVWLQNSFSELPSTSCTLDNTNTFSSRNSPKNNDLFVENQEIVGKEFQDKTMTQEETNENKSSISVESQVVTDLVLGECSKNILPKSSVLHSTPVQGKPGGLPFSLYNDKTELSQISCNNESILSSSKINLHANSINDKPVSRSMFDSICNGIKTFGECKNLKKCRFVHNFPSNLMDSIGNLPIEEMMNLYNGVKRKNMTYLLKKIFPLVTKRLGCRKDYLAGLVNDVLTLDMNSDRAPFINDIIKSLCNAQCTFNDTVEFVFRSANVNKSLMELLNDILLNITVERGELYENWSTIQMLLKQKDYDIDNGIIQVILIESLKENSAQQKLCSNVYNDLVQTISDEKISAINGSVLYDFVEVLKKVHLLTEAEHLYARCKSQNISGFPVVSASPTASSLNLLENLSVKSDSSDRLPSFQGVSHPAMQLLLKQSPSPVTEQSDANTERLRLFANTNWYQSQKVVNVDQSNNNNNNNGSQATNSNCVAVSPILQSPNACCSYTNEIRTAIYEEKFTQISDLIQTNKDTDSTDDFVKICVGAMLESSHSYATFFNNLSITVTATNNGTNYKSDNHLEYVMKTIGLNLVLYSVKIEKWDQAYLIHKNLVTVFNEDIFNVKLYIKENYSLPKRKLMVSEIYFRKGDFIKAWTILKDSLCDTDPFWLSEHSELDKKFRNALLEEMIGTNATTTHWKISLMIVQQLLKNNITYIDIKKYMDDIIITAINYNCELEDIIVKFISCHRNWYDFITKFTFRVILAKIINSGRLKYAVNLYLTGCDLQIYPFIFGNEQELEISTSYSFEEVHLMFNIFLQRLTSRDLKVNYPVYIKIIDIINDDRGSAKHLLSNILTHRKVDYATMKMRIINILNNHIKPGILVKNYNNILIIEEEQLNIYLERRKYLK